jgi:acetyl esterase/lipase
MTLIERVVLSLALSSAVAAAAEKLDLDRITPVPETQQIPIQDFFRLSLMRDPRINPAGTHIAALVTANEDKYKLLTYDLKSKKVELLGGSGESDIYQFAWLGDRRLMFSVSTRKLYGVGAYAGEIGSFNRSYPLLQYAGASLISVPRKNRARPLFWARSDIETGRDQGVVVVNSNLTSGKMINLVSAAASWGDVVEARENNDKKIVHQYPLPKGMGVSYMADKEGELAFAITQENGVFTLHRWTGTTWEKCPIDLEAYDIVGTGNKPGELVVLSQREGGKPRALQFMDAATGELGETLIQDPNYDFNGWLYRDPGTRDIVGAVYERNGPHVVWFNEGFRGLQNVLNGMFPGEVVRILGSDDAGRIFLIMTMSDRHPGSFHWVNLETREARTLDAYLTMPAGASKKNPPPLVVLPHGGPWARDYWSFDGEAQFLASRGYAVLQPNYRGSTGYGWMFPEEDDWAFRKMHDDVTDCVKLVLKSGHVDPSRVAIGGASFGAYLALSGVVNEPELYRCAIAVAGVFDWATVISESKYSQYDDPRYARLRKKLGDPSKEKAKFDEISPVRHVRNVRVPVFVSHGKDDPVAAVGESKRLIAELERHKVPHEVLLKAEEGHGMGRLKNRVELYGRIEAFLEKHLKGAGPSS